MNIADASGAGELRAFVFVLTAWGGDVKSSSERFTGSQLLTFRQSSLSPSRRKCLLGAVLSTFFNPHGSLIPFSSVSKPQSSWVLVAGVFMLERDRGGVQAAAPKPRLCPG